MVVVHYELSWTGSFNSYFVQRKGVLQSTNTNVYPISLFPIFKSINWVAPLFFYPLYETTSMPTCPTARNYRWQGVLNGFFGTGYFTLDSLGLWVVALALFMELVCHSNYNRRLRFQQRFVALVSTCLPAICMYVMKNFVCELVEAESGSCSASTSASQLVLLLLVGAFAFACSTFYGVSSSTAGHTEAVNDVWCFLTRNKKDAYAGHEAFLQMRSVMLVVFTATTNNGTFQAGLGICLLLISLIYQILHQPFETDHANSLESISTAALVVVLFVGMVGSIGSLDVEIVSDTLKYSGYTLVVWTASYATVVIAREILQERAERAKRARYVRVSLGLESPSGAELAAEKSTAFLVAFVREITQAMLQGDVDGTTASVRAVGACPFPDEQISQLLANSDLFNSVTMMRHTMFKSFVLSETKVWV
jgi:hypothetical protein